MQGLGTANPPSSFVDIKGRRWVLRRRITEWATLDGPARAPEYSHGAPDWDQLTDEELAERLRPVQLVGDAEYIRAEPDLTTVKWMRAQIAANAEFRGTEYRG
jgi:hypothetical protein